MEEKITAIICDIKILFDKIDKCLDNMEGESYIENNAKIAEYLTEIKNKKDYVVKNYPRYYVIKLNDEIASYTKLLSKKFDNVIKIKNEELQAISKEINAMQNQKKISNYR